jgi:hypothetical protein
MENKTASWQKRFGLTTCAAAAIESAIPNDVQGVAVIYEKTAAGEKVFLVIESRASGLRSQCMRRLQTAKLPPVELLAVAYKGEPLSGPAPEVVEASCRQQVILASELRRELRPAMR